MLSSTQNSLQLEIQIFLSGLIFRELLLPKNLVYFHTAVSTHCLQTAIFSCHYLQDFRSPSFVTEWNGNKLTGCDLLSISVFVPFLGFVYVCVCLCVHMLIYFLKICGWACQPALHLLILHWSFNHCWLFDLWHFEPNLALLLRQEEKNLNDTVFFFFSSTVSFI